VTARAAQAVLEVATPAGPARLHVDEPDGDRAPSGVLVLGHGAGGGVGAPDLLAAVAAARAAGWRAIRMEQPWRVAGRRVAPLPPRLDEAWLAALEHVDRAGPLVVGGRSAGARVACRTAVPTGAVAVLCLAFPLHPPGRPERSRAPELAGAGRPVVVVQGVRDSFGTPADLAALGLSGVEIVEAPSDHGLAPRTKAGRDELRVVVDLAVRRVLAVAASGA
jgi:predicted alpha/beta-hydrolase family hydrolase